MHWVRKSSLLHMALIAVVLTCNSLATAEECRDILREGIHNKFSEAKSNKFEEAVYQAVCTSNSSLNESNSRSGGTIGIPGVVDFGATTGNSKYSELKNRYCGEGKRKELDDRAQTIASEIVAPEVTREWSRCMRDKMNRYGLVDAINGDDDKLGGAFTYELQWRPTGSGGPYPKITALVVEGDITCTKVNSNYTLDDIELSPNTVRSQTCKRTGSGSASLYGRTDIGGDFGHVFSPIKEEQKTKSNKDLCMDGDATACDKHAVTIAGECRESDLNCKRKAQCWEDRGIANRQIQRVIVDYGPRSPLVYEAEQRLRFMNCEQRLGGRF